MDIGGRFRPRCVTNVRNLGLERGIFDINERVVVDCNRNNGFSESLIANVVYDPSKS